MCAADWWEIPARKLKISNSRTETSGQKVTERVVKGRCCEAGGKWQSLRVAFCWEALVVVCWNMTPCSFCKYVLGFRRSLLYCIERQSTYRNRDAGSTCLVQKTCTNVADSYTWSATNNFIITLQAAFFFVNVSFSTLNFFHVFISF